jgi:hypothetical protein
MAGLVGKKKTCGAPKSFVAVIERADFHPSLTVGK